MRGAQDVNTPPTVLQVSRGHADSLHLLIAKICHRPDERSMPRCGGQRGRDDDKQCYWQAAIHPSRSPRVWVESVGEVDGGGVDGGWGEVGGWGVGGRWPLVREAFSTWAESAKREALHHTALHSRLMAVPEMV